MSILLLESGTFGVELEDSAGRLALEDTTGPNVSPSSATIDQGATTTLTATGFTGGTVTWSSNHTGTATVNSGGVVTGQAHGQATAQVATITATGVANPSETATATITVNAVAVSVSPTSVTIGVSTTTTITPTVTGTTTTTVTWSVVSGGGSVNGSGVYTAPVGVTVAVVRATSTTDTARHDDCTVTVTTTRAVTTTAPYGVAYTGLSLGYTVYNANGTTYQAHTTSGVVEVGSTGIYIVELSLPQSFCGLIVWDAPSGLDSYVDEVTPYIVSAATTYTLLAVAPYGVAYTGLTIGYTIYNPDGTTTPAPGQAHTTSSVVEFASLGIYGIQLTFNLTDNCVVVWDSPSGLNPYVQAVATVQGQPTITGGGGSVVGSSIVRGRL